MELFNRPVVNSLNAWVRNLEKHFFLKGRLWEIQQKRIWKAVFSKNYTCVLNYSENFNFIVCAWCQNAKLFQFSSTCTHTVPELLTRKSWFFWNYLILISIKIIILYTKILTVECWAYWKFLLYWISWRFYNKNVIFIITIIIMLFTIFLRKMLFPFYTWRLPDWVATLMLNSIS